MKNLLSWSLNVFFNKLKNLQHGKYIYIYMGYLFGVDRVGKRTSARFRKPLGDRCRRALEFESAGGGFSLVWFIYNLYQVN
jgi:hypothetical protein